MPLPFKRFTYRRGDTPTPMRFRLTSRNVRTGMLKPRPATGDVVELTIFWPQKDAAVMTTAAGGGLSVDPVNRLVKYSITSDDLNAIGRGVDVPFLVRVTNEDNIRKSWAEGVICVEGEPT
jgi:hypothetical protein